MKLKAVLTEATTDFVVYRAYGPKSDQAYYGYCRASLDPLKAFLTGAGRTDEDRADVRLVQANGGDEDLIKVQVLDVCKDEVEAWMSRNEARASNVDSISGPTQFPGNIAKRAAQEHPERMEQIKTASAMKNAKTARDAYALGMWNREQIADAAARSSRDEVIKDLDSLTPVDFQKKHFAVA